MLFKPGSFLQSLFAPSKKSSARSVPGDLEDSKNKDLDVVSNPDSSEEDWLRAVHGVELQSQNAQCIRDNDASSSKWDSLSKNIDRLALRAVSLVALAGIGAFIAVTLQEHFIPKHVDSPWDHMVPLKERMGTSDPNVFRDKIIANWEPIKGSKKGYTVVNFDIRGDGSFKNFKVESSDTTLSQQQRAVAAVLTSGPFFCRTERTDKSASAKVYFDNGTISVETFFPRIYHGLDSVDTTDMKLGYPPKSKPKHGDHDKLEIIDEN
ncbi:MAG: hypothetical protein P4L53_18330 [Candidatus Obscuribacterales bacterium]|nr:hypothetical protein [Candidatus Obscuribacterales bacterium]